MTKRIGVLGDGQAAFQQSTGVIVCDTLYCTLHRLPPGPRTSGRSIDWAPEDCLSFYPRLPTVEPRPGVNRKRLMARTCRSTDEEGAVETGSVRPPLAAHLPSHAIGATDLGVHRRERRRPRRKTKETPTEKTLGR
jgi:hypothetical protein